VEMHVTRQKNYRHRMRNLIIKVYGQTATSQNGDTEMATEMAIFKTATNPNNTYSSSEAYIIDRRMYTCMACNC